MMDGEQVEESWLMSSHSTHSPSALFGDYFWFCCYTDKRFPSHFAARPWSSQSSQFADTWTGHSPYETTNKHWSCICGLSMKVSFLQQMLTCRSNSWKLAAKAQKMSRNGLSGLTKAWPSSFSRTSQLRCRSRWKLSPTSNTWKDGTLISCYLLARPFLFLFLHSCVLFQGYVSEDVPFLPRRSGNEK